MAGEIVLHIGTPKTASSSLQWFFWKNQERLRAQGIVYPDLCKFAANKTPDQNAWFGGNGAQMRNGFTKPFHKLSPVSKKIYQEIVSCAKQYDHVLISDENFYNYGNADFFSNLMRQGSRVRAVVYVRRQDKYLESLWSYFVKVYSDFNYKCRDFVHEVDNLPEFHPDYYEQLKEMASYIGVENIIVRSFDKIEENIYKDFIEAMGAKWDEKFELPTEHFNVKFDPVMLEVKRRLNDLRLPDQKVLDRFANEAQNARREKGSMKGGFLSIEDRTEIMERYEESNRKLTEEFCQGVSCFQAEITGKEAVLNEQEVEQEMLAILEKICLEQDKRIGQIKKPGLFTRLCNKVARNIDMLKIILGLKDIVRVKNFKRRKEY